MFSATIAILGKHAKDHVGGYTIIVCNVYIIFILFIVALSLLQCRGKTCANLLIIVLFLNNFKPMGVLL